MLFIICYKYVKQKLYKLNKIMETTKQELEKRKEEILNDLKNRVQIGDDNIKWIGECIDTMISDELKREENKQP